MMLSWEVFNWKQALKMVSNCSKKIRKRDKGKVVKNEIK